MVGESDRVHRADEFSFETLLGLKGSTAISVCLPARNEEATIAPIVESIVNQLGPGPGGQRPDRERLVDEVVVMDDRSIDSTGEVAAAAGARVIHVEEILPSAEPGWGKGNAMWKSVAACEGDLIVWVDADLLSFTPAYVLGLLGPLLKEPSVAMVKGFYERPEQGGAGGGRTTELMARPVLATFFPDLAGIRQPLGGEYASRRSVLERLPFAQGYGVETGLLIDIARAHGVEQIAQVDLGVRSHRNRPLNALSTQAMEVLHAALVRAGVSDRELGRALTRPGHDPTEIQVAERPPLVDVPEYERPRPSPNP